MAAMRRTLCLRNLLRNNQHYISPLSISSSMHFCSKKRHKTKIIFGTDEDDNINENIEEATIEQETKKPHIKSTEKISKIKLSDTDQEKPKSFKHRVMNYFVNLDDILPRMIALRNKDPAAVAKTMNAFYLATGITGIPFFLLCWNLSSYIIFKEELICAYLFTRITTNIFPGSTMNNKLVNIYKSNYPLLDECKWSRKFPDPSSQSLNAMADEVANKMPKLKHFQNLVNNEGFPGKYLKGFQSNKYANSLQHGFVWDVADNTRVLITLPLLTGLLYCGGLGTFITSFDWNTSIHLLSHWWAIYIGGAYAARLCSSFALRVMALTVIEKRFGLRNDSGEYFGSIKNMETNEPLTGGKVSSRKPKKNT